MESIALAFSNTVDYEVIWDYEVYQNLILELQISQKDLYDRSEIRTLKDLVSLILFHMSKGSGKGMVLPSQDVLAEFIDRTEGNTTLGGTNVRAGLVLSDLGKECLVHLVSVNEETTTRLPPLVRFMGGELFTCCYHHVAVQYPAAAKIDVGDIKFISPNANRVLFSADIACARMPISSEFMKQAKYSKILVLSGFDMILDYRIVKEKLIEVRNYISSWQVEKPVIYYEHAGFSQAMNEQLVLNLLPEVVDIIGMNEDELSGIVGDTIDLLNVESVSKALSNIRNRFPLQTFVVHTRHWVLACGQRAKELKVNLEDGMDIASTRYRCGVVNHQTIIETQNLPKQEQSIVFSKEIESCFEDICCIPAYKIPAEKVTTVGLGDSFVGGFAMNFGN